MISLNDYTAHDGLGLAELVARKEVTPDELAAAAFEAVGKINPRINAVLHTLPKEAAAEIRARHTLFARAERVEKDELFAAGDPRAGEVLNVGKLSAGYRLDLWRGEHLAGGVGVLGSLLKIPERAEAAYGSGTAAGMLFARLALR